MRSRAALLAVCSLGAATLPAAAPTRAPTRPVFQARAAAPAPAPAAQAALKPASNLKTDGIPDIPAELAEAVGRYTEFRTASLASWHPTRREMLILTRFGDTAQVHEVRMPGGARRQLTFFADRVGQASWPRRSADFFVFTKDRGGDEFSQIYRFDVATGAITLVSDGGRSQNGLGPWSHAGDRLAFGSTRRNGTDRDIYVMDPKDPATTRLVLEVKGGGWGPADWSPDDTQLAVTEEISINESYVWIVDVATGQATLATPKGGPEKVAYPNVRWSADGKGLFVTTDRESEFLRLAHVDLASGKHTYLSSHLPWDVESFVLSPDGRTIAFETNEEGLSVLHLLDTATGKENQAPLLPLGVIGEIEWHNDGRNLGLSVSSARSPSDVYSLDVTTGSLERWTESETGGLQAAAFPEPELIHWKSFDGKTVSGLLYRPAGRFAGPRPVIVNIHGGPEGQARPSFLGRNNFYLNELGVAMIFPNVRGSTGFGKSFAKLDNGVLREDSVKDIGALLDWTSSARGLDPSRVMITGGSYGGYMTLAAATQFDARIRCSVEAFGISNFVTFLETTESYRRDLRRAEYGDERDPTMREHLLRISPLRSAHRITKPLLVVQGRNDPRVPASESEQMVATIKRNGGPVWYLLASDEGHGFAKKKNQDFQLYATVLFAKEHLLK